MLLHIPMDSRARRFTNFVLDSTRSQRVGANFPQAGTSRLTGKHRLSVSGARLGFTLLEVVLALAIASLLLFALGAGIRVQLRAMDVGRTDVEEAQVARAVLKMIADDLRGAMYFTEQDVSGATGAVSSAAGSAGASGSSSTSSSSTSGSGASSSGATAGGSSSSSSSGSGTSSDAAEIVRRPPGIYGDQYSIEIDVNRAPREDEYELLVQQVGENSVGIHPSEVRTVSYFITQGSGIASSITSKSITADTGLARGERDRASAAYLYASGVQMPSSDRAELLAPEVQALEFRYFDGESFYESWNTEERGALPLAVEVMIQVRTSDKERGVEQSSAALALDEGQTPGEWLVYRLTVKIPQGKASSLDEESSSSSEGSSSSGSGSGSSSGSSSSSSGSSAGSSSSGGR